MSAIPLADAGALRRPARLTLAVRTVLGAAARGLAIAFLLLSRHPHTSTVVPLPRDSGIVVVLDVSASISSDTYSRIGGTLAAIARSGARTGLVVFSDSAYEALPPGTPASSLTPFVRYFTLPQQTQAGFAPTFPPNPWTNAFTGGTRISTGMELAHAIAQAQARRPTVVLVSDLDDDPDDLAPLAGVLAAYGRDRIPVRVVGLDPSPEDVTLFRRLVGSSVPVAQAPTPEQVPAHDVTAFPTVLLALALAAAVALALREAWSPRLEWSGS
jgi:hypothetical protein